MIFIASLVLLLIIKLRFPKGKSNHHERPIDLSVTSELIDGECLLMHYHKQVSLNIGGHLNATFILKSKSTDTLRI